MQEPAEEIKAIGIALERHLASARLACATELAHARHYAEAEELLRANGRNVTSPEELDLLARIAGKQGRLDDARSAWETAASSSPDDGALKQSLANLRRYTQNAGERRQLFYGLVIAVVVALIFLASTNALFGPPGKAGQMRPGAQATPTASTADSAK